MVKSTGWVGGYCTIECDLNCREGAACLVLGDVVYCMTECKNDDGCRDEYLCSPWSNVCLPDCRLGYECGELECTDDGYCVDPGWEDPGTTKAVAPLGEPRRLANDCESDLCIPQQDTDTGITWSEGMCIEPCGECPDDFYCTSLGELSYCLPDCDDNNDCRDGYVCNPIIRACVPDCRIGFDCGDYACNDAGACEQPPA
ncbi:MAG: hypothetical protein V3V08_14555 [Nannocystaceae bacterium]